MDQITQSEPATQDVSHGRPSKTDIWFPFFIGDYLADTMRLSTTQHGTYLLLLLAYYKAGGPLPDDDPELANTVRMTLSDWTAARPAMARFFNVEGGRWIHRRADREIERAKSLQAARRQGAAKTNAKLGRTLSDTLSDTPSDTGATRSRVGNSQSDSHSQELRHTHPSGGAEKSHPALKDVLAHAALTGCPEDTATKFWNYFEAAGWIDRHGHPIVKWQPKLATWLSDERQRPAETAHRASSNGTRTKPPSTYDMQKALEANEALAKRLKDRHYSQTATGGSWDDDKKRAEFQALRVEVNRLQAQIGKSA